MPALKTIPGIKADEVELLEAAGFLDTTHLSKVTAEELHRELEKANKVLEIVKVAPSLDRVSQWVGKSKRRDEKSEEDAAGGAGSRKRRKRTEEREKEDDDSEVDADGGHRGPRENESAVVDWVDYEADPSVQEMIDRSPLAIPIPAKQLADHGIAPVGIAAASVLNRALGDLEIRATAKARQRSRSGTPRRSSSKPLSSLTGDAIRVERMGIDATRVRSLDDARDEGDLPTAPLERGQVDERMRLLTTARESTNRGKSRDSRFYIRGVLHDRWLLVSLGSIAVLLLALDVPLAILGSLLLVLSDLMPEAIPWAPKWLLVFPLLLPVFGLLYFIFSIRVKCRVCGQKEYVPRHCLKHVKAHHVPGLGHIVPLAVHVLLFKWFHCTFCGTAVRIKE